MELNPYESPREQNSPLESPPEARSLEAGLRRKMTHVAFYASMFAIVGVIAIVVWILSHVKGG